MEDYDDDGFYGYVPDTNDPGPILLVATIAIGAFIWMVLPIAVILGDKYEELAKRKHDNETEGAKEILQEDENMESNSKLGGRRGRNAKKKYKEMAQGSEDDDDASVASRGTIYSAISEVVKEMLEQKNGRIKRSRGRKHRRVHKPITERSADSSDDYNETHHDYGQDDDDNNQRVQVLPWLLDTSDNSTTAGIGNGVYSKDNDSHPADVHLNGDGTDALVSLAGSVVEESILSDCGTSQFGQENKIVTVTGHNDMLDDTINRNACLSVEGFLDEIAAIMAWDFEMKRIIKLSIPFATQAIFTGALDTLTVGVIGKLIGTREVSAFVIANLLVEMSTHFVGKFSSSHLGWFSAILLLYAGLYDD